MSTERFPLLALLILYKTLSTAILDAVAPPTWPPIPSHTVNTERFPVSINPRLSSFAVRTLPISVDSALSIIISFIINFEM